MRAPSKSVPWFTTSFWEDNSPDGFRAVASDVARFAETLRDMEQLDALSVVVSAQGERGVAVTKGASEASLAACKQSAKHAVEAVSQELDAAVLTTDEAYAQAADSQARLGQESERLFGADGHGGALGALSNKSDALIGAIKSPQHKELSIKVKRGILQLIIDTGKLVVSAYTFGTGSSAGASRVAKLDPRSPALAAAAKSIMSKPKRSDPSEGLRDLQDETTTWSSALREASSAADQFGGSAGELLGEMLAIGSDIATLLSSAAESERIDREAREAGQAASAAVGEMRNELLALAHTVGRLTLTLLMSKYWVHAEMIAIGDTRLDPAVLVSPAVWDVTRSKVLELLTTEFQMCPGESAENPYAPRRRLGAGAAASSSSSRNSRSSARGSARSFGRSLGDKDTKVEQM